ncbi:MAG: hypothetical protein IPL61_33005 [Myxococcales bacterium]|nr:hypothetical protein [Myxococcales bacterium]
MTTPATTLAWATGLLDQLGIPHMVVGSFASSAHGLPRTTQDIDVVIDPTPAQLTALLAAIDLDRFYVDADTARDALRRRGMFNIIDMANGWKLDLVIRKATAHAIEELERRVVGTVAGVPAPLATAEDVIIGKLMWARAGASDRQLADVAGILTTRGPQLDRPYLARWIGELGLDGEWQRAQALAT